MSKVKTLLKIEKQRIKLGIYLKNGFINESDIIGILTANPEYGVLNSGKNLKKGVLRDIFNCPFLLCDQVNMNKNVKSMLPEFLQYRYNMEVSELEFLYDNGDITLDEYNDQKEMMTFCFFESSIDGKNILNNSYNNEQNLIKVK